MKLHPLPCVCVYVSMSVFVTWMSWEFSSSTCSHCIYQTTPCLPVIWEKTQRCFFNIGLEIPKARCLIQSLPCCTFYKAKEHNSALISHFILRIIFSWMSYHLFLISGLIWDLTEKACHVHLAVHTLRHHRLFTAYARGFTHHTALKRLPVF